MFLKTEIEGKAIFTTEQAAELLNCHKKTIERWCRSGKMKAFKPGKRWYVLGEDLREWLTGGG